MPDFGSQVGVFMISWIFWYIIISLFVYLFQRKTGKTLGRRERIFLVGKVALLCAAANVAINSVSRPY